MTFLYTCLILEIYTELLKYCYRSLLLLKDLFFCDLIMCKLHSDELQLPKFLPRVLGKCKSFLKLNHSWVISKVILFISKANNIFPCFSYIQNCKAHLRYWNFTCPLVYCFRILEPSCSLDPEYIVWTDKKPPVSGISRAQFEYQKMNS